jgi:translocation and assembly module TamB
VYFRGFGAFAHLEGTLRVRGEVPEPPSGSGEIRIIDGSYRAYGQNLQIEDGRVIFSGPLSTPRLDIKAFLVADDGTEAGVHVRGTPEQPELRVYSDPAMSEGRALNYLLTGRAPDGGSGTGNTAALLGSNVLSTRMSSSLGLDEARVEGDSLDESTLVAGKYISPQLYLAYAKSLYDSTRALRIRYLFSRSWSVQAETGSTMGADIFYNFELGGQ